jgi:hypothetical protein
VHLKAGESLLVQRKNLVAYSLDSNAVAAKAPEPYYVRDSLVTHDHQQSDTALKPEAAKQPVGSRLWNATISQTVALATWLSRLVKSDSAAFLKMHGPTTLLLQSQTHSSISIPSVALPGTASLVNPIEAELASRATRTVNASDYALSRAKNTGLEGIPEHHLKVATVVNGKVTFTSTQNFIDFTMHRRT